MIKSVFNDYVTKINNTRRYNEMKDIKNESIESKQKKLNELAEQTKNIYTKELLFNIYENALPLNKEYKCAYKNELREYFEKFLEKTLGNNVFTYISSNSMCSKNIYAKNLSESVDELVKEQYKDIRSNFNNISYKDIIFEDIESDTMKDEISVINRDLNGDDVSEIIKDNVRKTALNEIKKAKEEKEKMKQIETDLMNDVKIDSEEKIEEAVQQRLGKPKRYEASLFEYVMISKYKSIEESSNHDVYNESPLYDTMKEFGKNESSYGDVAFIESIKEYTGLSLLNATKILPINNRNLQHIKNKYNVQ